MHMQPKSQALMSLYDGSYSWMVDKKHTVNPLLQALYLKHKNDDELDVQVISDHKNIAENSKFRKFNKCLKKLNCDVREFDPLVAKQKELSLFNNPDYASFHQKFYVFNKCYRGGPLAVTTSHNPTKDAFTEKQKIVPFFTFCRLREAFLSL